MVSLSEAAAVTAELIGQLTDPQWDAVKDGWSFDVPVRGAMVHLLHDLEHHLLDVNEFVAFCQRTHGTVEPGYHRRRPRDTHNHYLEIGGHSYWGGGSTRGISTHPRW